MRRSRERLKRQGIKAFFVRDISKLGLTDEQQIETAIKKQAVIFTHDVDFIKMAIHKQHLGIIYVHQQKLTVGEIIKRLKTIAQTKTQKK